VAAPVLSLESQLHAAVLEVRLARHTPECVCGLYRPEGGDDKGSPHCTQDEYMACRRVNLALTTMRRASF
jgi:hypothetical protein